MCQAPRRADRPTCGDVPGRRRRQVDGHVDEEAGAASGTQASTRHYFSRCLRASVGCAIMPPSPPQDPARLSSFWKRFARNRLALLGLAVISLIVLAAVFAPVLAPFDPAEQLFEGLTLS